MKACKGLGGASPLKKGILTNGVAKINITGRSNMTGGATYLSLKNKTRWSNMSRSKLIGGVLGEPIAIKDKGRYC